MFPALSAGFEAGWVRVVVSVCGVVRRGVEEAQQRLGEVGKSENGPLFLQLGAPAVAHNCR